MKYLVLSLVFTFFTISSFGASRYWVASSTSNWNNTANWSTTSGGAGGASVPTVGDFVYFNANGLGNCNIDIGVAIDGIQISGYTGTIDLNGFSFDATTSGIENCTFASGTISDTPGTSSITHSTSGTNRFSGTTFNVPINVTANLVDFDGGTFNDPVVVENNSSGSPWGAGGCTFNSTFQVTNSGTGNFTMGQSSGDTFNSTVTLINTSTNRIRMANTASGTQFNGNITVENTGGGIYFGDNSGTSTLADTRTITVGAGGFSAGTLLLEEFTQLGATAQNISLSGTARLRVNPGTVFNATVDFDAPRIVLDEGTFNSITDIEKTGASDDSSPGGNSFAGNLTLRNSGSGYFLMGNGTSDSFTGNVTMLNSGTRHMYLAYNSSGNTIGGDLTITNTTSGTGGDIRISSTSSADLTIGGNVSMAHSGSGTNGSNLLGDDGDLTVSGTVTINNSGSGTNNYTYIGDAGTITITGDLTIVNDGSATNSQVFVANGTASSITLNGATNITNSGSGTTSRIYLGNNGDITFNGVLTMTNSSAATNSQVYLNHNDNSSNSYNQNIVFNSTNAASDGFLFGNSDGSGTLAASRTVTIGAGGYIAGSMYFRNFTQTGATAQTLQPTGTTFFRNYDSNWGGNVDFRSPRIRTRGTTYSGTAYLEKTGGVADDASDGGNTFSGNTELVNSGSEYFLMGNSSPDTFAGNVVMTNSGSNNMYLAHNTAGNTIAGTLTVTHSASGTNSNVYLATNTASDLTIDGNANFTVNGSATTSGLRIASSGSVTFNGDLNLTQNTTATNADSYVASGTTSSVTVAGDATFSNNGAGTAQRIWIGNSGDVTFNGSLSISNASTATYSAVYLNHNVASVNSYNGDIVLECTDASCDGIYFGNSGGSGTLAATQTVTIGASGFIAGDLQFRNFTQVGATPQTLLATGTARIRNQDSNWGGNIDFRAPRMNTQGTTYSGTCILEKTGGIANDNSIGGNTFSGNTELINSGSEQFLMGNGNPDVFSGNLILTNSGTDHLYLGYNSAGNTIAGDLTITHSTSGSYGVVSVSSQSASTVTVGGNVDADVTGTTNDARLYLGNSGSFTVTGNADVDFNSSGTNGTFYSAYNGTSIYNGDLTITYSNSGTNRYMYLAHNGTATVTGNLTVTNSSTANSVNLYTANASSSSVTVNGTATFSNSGAGTTKRIYVGNQGDLTFNGPLNLANSSSASNSEIYVNYNSSSAGAFNDNIVVECTDASSDGIRFGANGGSGTLAATQTVAIGAGGFISGNLEFRNFTQIGGTPQTLLATGTARIYNYDSNWGGNIDFRAPRMNTRGTTYNGTCILEKTGGVGDDNSVGGNTFVGNTQLINTGSNQFLMGNGNPDDFQADLDITNSGTDHFYLAYNSSGNTVDGDLNIAHSVSGSYGFVSLANQSTSSLTVGGPTVVTINSTSSDSRFYLGYGGDITFNDDLTVNVAHTTGLSYGYLATSASSNVTVAGNTIFNNTSAGTTSRVYVANSGTATFTGDLTLTNNTTSTNGRMALAQAATSSATVNGNTTITNAGASTTKRMYIGNSGNVTFNGTVDITNSSSANNSQVYLNYYGTGTYNDDITVAVTDTSCDGILFGPGGGAGTLADGETITISASGYIAGYLYFRNFTQIGSTAQTLQPTGTSRIENYDSEWNGNIDFRAPRHYTRGTTYNGTALLEKNGASNDPSVGGNIFNASTTLRVTGTGYFMPANGTGNDFNADVTYVKTGTGAIHPTYNSTSTYAGNITVESNAQVTFGSATNGRAQFDGSSAQSINAIGATPTTRFRDLQTSNTADEITLNAPIIVITELDLDAGNIVSTTANLIFMNDNSIVSSVSDDAYVSGPIEKIGNDAFTFPVGKGGLYRYCAITAPTSGSARFRAEYFPTDPGVSYDPTSLDPTIVQISTCEYWTIDRISSSNNVSVTLSFEGGSPGCSGVDPAGLPSLIVARWDGAVWRDHGNGGTTGTSIDGDVISSAAVTSFSPFTLGTTTSINPLPVELVEFEVEKNDDKTLIQWTTKSEVDNKGFEVQHSTDGVNFETIDFVEGAGNSSVEIDYRSMDYDPYQGVNYYRLKQIDFNGDYEYSPIRSVEFDFGDDFVIYPNPINTGSLLSIQAPANDQVDKIVIRDASGRIIYKQDSFLASSRVEIETIDLSSGIYIIEIQAGNKTISKKLIKS